MPRARLGAPADLAMKPKGWSFLQHFLSSERRAWAIPDILARSESEIGLRLKDMKLENRFKMLRFQCMFEQLPQIQRQVTVVA